MNSLFKFIKTAIIYFLGNILNKLIALILLPLYTRLISPEQFGYFDLSTSLLSLIVPLLFFQIWDGVFRYIYDYDSKEDKYVVVTNGFFLMIISLFLFSIAFIFFSSLFSFQYKILIYLFGVSSAFQYFYSMITRAFGKNIAFMISGTVSSLSTILVNIVLIVVYKMDGISLFISIIVGTIIQIVILEVCMQIFKHIRFDSLNRILLKQILKFSVPIGVGTISYWLIIGLSKVMVSAQLGVAENGIFAVANRFTGMIAIFITVFQLSWNEVSFSIAKNDDRSTYYNKGINMLYKFISLGTIALIPLTKFIFPLFVDSQYSKAVLLIPIVYFSTMVNSFGSFLGSLFLAEKKSNIMFYSTIIASIVNIICLFFLIPVFELYGAAISLSIAFIINTSIRIIMLRNLQGIKLNYKFILFSIILFIITSIVFYLSGRVLNVICLIGIIFLSIYSFKDILFKFINVVRRKIVKMLRHKAI